MTLGNGSACPTASLTAVGFIVMFMFIPFVTWDPLTFQQVKLLIRPILDHCVKNSLLYSHGELVKIVLAKYQQVTISVKIFAQSPPESNRAASIAKDTFSFVFYLFDVVLCKWCIFLYSVNFFVCILMLYCVLPLLALVLDFRVTL